MGPRSIVRVSILAAAALFYSLFAAGDDDLQTSTTPEIAWAAADFSNPVLNQNFPDPAILEADGTFYAFATNTGNQNIPLARSEDLVTWSMLPDAMPQLAPWVAPVRGQVWAPETIAVGGEYRMYYTARDRKSNRQCIGVASSAAPEGPYRDEASTPLLCPEGFQRAIDAHPYFDGKQLYLYFSGVCCGEPNGIFIQQLDPKGLATVGQSSLILKVDTTWEGDIAEAPTMVKRGGKYYLFYSGNDYRNQTYAVGYAVCKSAKGPCTKAEENPVLVTGSSSSRALGPGHQSIARVGDDYWMLFHGWNDVIGYRNGGSRVMWLQPLTWKDNRPAVGWPTGS